MTPVWIFGYGSLIWRPDFPFLERRPCWVTGFERRFWQGSTDHRGTPGRPGRVVTLLPSPTARCRGLAYALEPSVLDHLDRREIGGYVRTPVVLELDDGGPREGLVYVATPDNPEWLGDAPLEAIAEQILASHGPSGSNVEYLLHLASSLRALGSEDPHVEALAFLVRERLAARG